MAAVLVIARLCEPSSELQIAEDWYRRTSLDDLLGLPEEKVNDDRLYRALDRLLPHKNELEQHIRDRLGSLFKLDYDLLLYDVTSTYFEGQATANELAARGLPAIIDRIASKCVLALWSRVKAIHWVTRSFPAISMTPRPSKK
jgi:hypothetical protein